MAYGEDLGKQLGLVAKESSQPVWEDLCANPILGHNGKDIGGLMWCFKIDEFYSFSALSSTGTHQTSEKSSVADIISIIYSRGK